MNELAPEDERAGLIWVIGAIGLVLGIIAILGSTVAILTSEKLDTAIHDYKISQYERDVTGWHQLVTGCVKSRTAIHQNTKEILGDAVVVSNPRTGSSSPTIRRHYALKAIKLRGRLALIDPAQCLEDYPRPTPPVGVKPIR